MALRRVLHVCSDSSCSTIAPHTPLLGRYRRVRGLFAGTEHWASFDCFASQKLEAFRSSSKGIHTLAKAVQELVKKGKTDDEVVLHADWQAMLEVCLWGESDGFQYRLGALC